MTARQAKAPGASTRPVDDMHDSDEELGKPGPLGDFLRLCDPNPDVPVDLKHPPADPSVREAFDIADGRAKNGQATFRWITRHAAWLGMWALILMLARLAVGEGYAERVDAASSHLPAWQSWLLRSLYHYGDAALAVAAFLFVLRGLLDFKHEEWLAQRFEAERHRLLKFRRLIDPRTWTRDRLGTAEWRQELQHEVQTIRGLSHFSPAAMGLGEDVPRLPPPAVWSSQAFDPASTLLGDIVAYYRRRRLDSQIGYFLRKGSAHGSSIGNRRLPPLVFFFGVVCVIIAVLLEAVVRQWDLHGLESWALVFVFLGGAAPAFSAAIRTIRAAYEWERNADRSSAMHATLTKIGQNLYDEQMAQTATPQNIFAYLSLCEFALACDQREWMRLMSDAEWYG